MLCKLSFKNIQKSFKDYAIYFFTLILGVSIFYIFNALDSQTVMLNISSSTAEIVKLMIELLGAVSIFISFILGFLIIYASRFLIKRRKKEFGIYLTLGMSKRKISMILFMETLFIGMISLAIGLILGILLSQFMSIFVANLFEADLTRFTFIFSKTAMMKTLIYFGLMYLFVMIFNTINITKCKLIDLLHASKKSERIHLKNPVICTIIFLISISFLTYAYYSVTVGVEKLLNFQDILTPIVIGCISTFFLFWSLSGLLVKIVTKMKKIYFHGLNSFTIKQVSSKINTTVFSMTLISLMLFVTICVLSSALSLKNSMTSNLKTLAPVDIELEKKRNLTLKEIENQWNLNQNMIEDSTISLEETLKKFEIDYKNIFEDTILFSVYNEQITLKDTLGTYYEEAKRNYPYLRDTFKEDMIRLSDYNAVAQLFGLSKYTLNENEYILISDYETMIPLRNEALKRNTSLTILGKNYFPKYSECQDGFIHISSNHINMGIFIVPDNAVNDHLIDKEIWLANYKNAKEKEEKQKIEDVILNIEKHPYIKNTSLNITTKIALYEASIGLGALVTFIGLYIGIIFLISSAAILALKELSESSDNIERFQMLRKIGVDEKMIHQALFYQIGIFFLFPLIIAMIHSIFGISFCNYILETIGNEKLLESIIMTSIFLVIIYGGYFLITYICSKNIIKEK